MGRKGKSSFPGSLEKLHLEERKLAGIGYSPEGDLPGSGGVGMDYRGARGNGREKSLRSLRCADQEVEGEVTSGKALLKKISQCRPKSRECREKEEG